MLSSGWVTRRTPASASSADMLASGDHRAKRCTSGAPVAWASKATTSASVHSDRARSGWTTPAAKRELPHPAATMTMRESSAGWAASKSITAASTRAARCGSVRAWRVAPVIEDCGPAVSTAPAPMRYSSIVTLLQGRVPTGWPTKMRPYKKIGGADFLRRLRLTIRVVEIPEPEEWTLGGWVSGS